MAPQPLFCAVVNFQSLNPLRSREDSTYRRSAPLRTIHTQRHPFLEWQSKPRPQSLLAWRQFMSWNAWPQRSAKLRHCYAQYIDPCLHSCYSKPEIVTRLEAKQFSVIVFIVDDSSCWNNKHPEWESVHIFSRSTTADTIVPAKLLIFGMLPCFFFLHCLLVYFVPFHRRSCFFFMIGFMTAV
jgi:hypothetical protein